jgi:hypothetical protein
VPVQRSLASVLFLLAGVALSLAVGGWWLQRTVLTPDDSASHAEAILDDPDILSEVTTVVAAATAPALGQEPNELAAFISPLIGSHPGAGVMGDILDDAHRRVLGTREDPVRITGAQMVEIVRDERAYDVASVTLPVPEVGTARLLDDVLTWMVPIAAILGAIMLLLAFITRPEKGEIVRALGEFGIALAVSMLLFGYVIPVWLVPAIDDNTWTRAIPQLALRTLPVELGAALVLTAGGIVLIISSSGTGRRKQWSTPLAVGRYREDRSWN